MNGRALAGHPCWSWLAADLSRLQPRVMVTLGAVVGQALSLTLPADQRHFVTVAEGCPAVLLAARLGHCRAGSGSRVCG
jgi:hypothetical protein